MDRHATEIEQVARQAIIGTTMEIDLGVRSWSNVSPKLSTSALLYDSAWKRAIAVHGDKPKAWKASGIWPSKKVAFSLVAMLAASSAIGFGVTQFMGNHSASAAVQVPAPQPKQAAKVAPPSPTLTTAAVAPQFAVAVPAPVVAKAEEQNAPQPPVIASPVEPVQPAPAVKTLPAAAKPAAPVPAHREEKPPVKAAIVLPAVPSFPVPLGLPPKASDLPPSRAPEPSSAPAKEQPLLAVDETVKPAQASARATEKPEEPKAAEKPLAFKPADADTEASHVEPKPAVKPAAKLAEPKVTEQPIKLAEPREMPRRVVVAPAQPDKPLPIFTVLAPSAGGVVISDPETRLPKEFRVGQKLPSGEVIKSVTKSGEVVTDRRTLKMSE